MIRQGRMTDAGLEKIMEAKKNGSWRTLDNVEKLKTIPPDLTKALSAHKEARKNFENLTPTSKKQFLWWIESAKKEETRKKRIVMTVDLVSRRKTLSDY